jgi:hypothetical protein
MTKSIQSSHYRGADVMGLYQKRVPDALIIDFVMMCNGKNVQCCQELPVCGELIVLVV